MLFLNAVSLTTGITDLSISLYVNVEKSLARYSESRSTVCTRRRCTQLGRPCTGACWAAVSAEEGVAGARGPWAGMSTFNLSQRFVRPACFLGCLGCGRERARRAGARGRGLASRFRKRTAGGGAARSAMAAALPPPRARAHLSYRCVGCQGWRGVCSVWHSPCVPTS